MTREELYAKVRAWDFQHAAPSVADARYATIINQLEYHASRQYRVYLPAEHSDFNSSYMERLATWIGNVSDESDQKLLLEYALYISFFSHEDFVALYSTAFNREVTRWVAEQVGARLESNGSESWRNLVKSQIHQHTWFCPVTDSMDINEFYKVNHLKGVGHRPGFATLQMLAESAATLDPALAKNLSHYMANPSLNPHKRSPSLERVVLLEDIVGSGTQCLAAIRWAIANLHKPILFIPLILCPNGVDALREEVEKSNGRLTVRPVIEISRSELLGPERQGHKGWAITPQLEEFAACCNTRASPSPMDMFGYKNTGCSLTTFSNTPNNTLPIVHSKTSKDGGWEPLFPRVFRD